MKLPKASFTFPKVPARLHLGLAVGMAVLLIGSVFANCADFPWNGNPFEWMHAKDLVAEGKRQREAFHLEDALRYFQQAVNIYPNDGNFQFALGETYERLRQFPEAQKALEKSTELSPKNVAAWLHLSEVLSIVGQPKAAEEMCRKALSVQPLNADAECQLALLLYLSGKKEDADKAFESTRNMERNSARYWYLSGRIYGLQQKPQETEAAFRQAVELQRTEPEYSEWLAVSLMNSHKIDEAIEDFQRATKLDPSNAMYWNNLSSAAIAKGDAAIAENACKMAANLDPKNLAYSRLYGMLLFRLKKYNQAEPIFKNLVAKNPTDGKAWNFYIYSQLNQKKLPECEKSVRDFMSLADNKKDPRLWTMLGDILRLENRPDEAREAYRQGLALHPNERLTTYLEKRIANPFTATATPGNNQSEKTNPKRSAK